MKIISFILFYYFVFIIGDEFYCDGLNSCNYNGVCNLNNTGCICNNKYITYKSTDIQCNYQLKDQKTAFYLSIFLGFFACAQFYIGNYIIAGPKLGVNLINCFLIGYFKCSNNKNNQKNILCIILFSLIGFIWWLSDIILFNLNYYTDRYNINLYYL